MDSEENSDSDYNDYHNPFDDGYHYSSPDSVEELEDPHSFCDIPPKVRDCIDIVSDNKVSREVAFNEHGSNLIDGLKKLRKENNEFADFGLKVSTPCGDGVILVHGCILASHSPFVAAFRRNMGRDASLDLTQWNKNIVDNLMDWVYEGVLKINTTNCYELLELSDYLCLNRVSEECIKFVCCKLNFENCCEAYMFSLHHHSEDFKKNTRRYFLTNFCQLLKGSYLTRLPRDHLLSLLADDNLVIVDDNYFLLGDSESEMRLFDLLTEFIDSNEVYDLWPSILENVLRFGFISETDLKRLVQSAPEGWLQKCEHKLTCLELLEKVQDLKCSHENLSASNCLWTRHRDVFKAINHVNTRMIANTPNTLDRVTPIVFDDVTTILEDLRQDDRCLLVYITGMKFYTRIWDGREVIGGIEVIYNTGKSILHGSTQPVAEIHEFKLQSGERIVSVGGKSGWLIDRLEFETSLGRKFGPYGGEGGSKINVNTNRSGSYMAGIKGRVDTSHGDTYVRHLNFIWGYLDLEFSK